MLPSAKKKKQMKPTMRYPLTTVKLAVIKKIKQCVGEDVEKRELLCTVENVNWYSHYGKCYGSSSRNYKWSYHMIQKSHFWV